MASGNKRQDGDTFARRVQRFGNSRLDGTPQRLRTSSIDQLAEWLASEPPGEAAFELTGIDAPEWEAGKQSSLPTLEKELYRHVFHKRITDRALKAEIESRLAPFYVDVIAKPDHTVKNGEVLKIDGKHTTADFGKLTIETGGRIEITVPCTLTADELIRM